MYSLLMRLLGVLLLTAALCLISFWRRTVPWLGRPLGWGSLWESYQGATGMGGCIYAVYRAYIVMAGWFYVIILTLMLGGAGYELLTTGKW